MKRPNHGRFIAGNQELREILRRAEKLEKVPGTTNDRNLMKIGIRLLNQTPEIGDASRCETLDRALLDEVAEYVKNLLALQKVIETFRSAPVDRRAPTEAAKGLIDGLNGWIYSYRHAT